VSFAINTNVLSLTAQRNLTTSERAIATTMQRLSSGVRINSAKDDAAGLAIAERMTSQIRGLDQAARNANDGISLVQTAEGALQEVTNNMQRIRELAVQSANGSNSATDRAALQTEVTELLAEIDRVAVDTEFNGTKLLNGSFTAVNFQVGANSGQVITIAALSDTQTGTLGIDVVDISTAAGADTALGLLDTALQTINDDRASMGAIQNRFGSVVASLQTSSENLSAARSRIQDTDFAAETAKLTRGQILQQAGTAILAQANSLPNGVLALLRG
jgi:flagellin